MRHLKKSTVENQLFIWRTIKPFIPRKMIFSVLFLNLASTTLDVFVALSLSKIQTLSERTDKHFSRDQIILFTLTILVIRSLAYYAGQKQVYLFGQRATKSLTILLTNKMLLMPLRKIQEKDPNHLLNAATNWANLIGGNGAIPLVLICSDLLSMTALCIVLFLRSPSLTIIAILLIILFGGLISKWNSSRVTNAAQRAVHAGQEVFSQIGTILYAMREIRLFNMEGYLTNVLNDSATRQETAQAEKTYLSMIPRIFLEFAGSLFLVILSMQRNDLRGSSIGNFTLFIYVMLRFMPIAGRTTTNLNSIKFANPVVRPVIELLQEDSRIQPAGSRIQAFSLLGEGQFELDLKEVVLDFGNGKFSQAISNEFHSGNIYALVGDSGSGKTTLLDTISGLQNAHSGEIVVGGNSASLTFLKNNCVLVSQQTTLFPGSLIWNLFFDEHPSKNSLFMAKDFFESLSLPVEWIDTNIQVGGFSSGFSGGELQRISLVRGLLQKKRILLLDEITSSLDHVSKLLVMETIKSQSLSNLVIISTHDSFMMQQADFKLSLNTKTREEL